MTTPFDKAWGEPEKKKPDPLDLAWDAPSTEVGRLTVATDRARKSNAALTAEAFNIARQVGLPFETVARNIESVKAEMGDADFDPQTFGDTAPATARWLTNEQNAAMSRDDWTKLQGIEQVIGRWSRLRGTSLNIGPMRVPIPVFQSAPGLLNRDVTVGLLNEELGQMTTRASVAERNTPEFQARRAELKARLTETTVPFSPFVPSSPFSWLAERMVRGTAQIAPSIVGGTVGAGVGAAAGAGAVGGIGLAVGGPAGGASGAAAGGAMGAMAGAAIYGYELEGGLAIDQFSDLVDDQGNRIDPAIADFAGRSVGVVSGLAEAVGLRILSAPFRKVAAGLMRPAMKAILTTPTLRRAMVAGLRAGGVAVAGETATEVAQQGMTLLGEQVARRESNLQDGTSFEDVPMQRVVEELTQTAVETVFSTLLIGGAGAGTTTFSMLPQIAEARQAQERLRMLGEGAEAVNLRKTAPEAFRELVQAQTEAHGPVQDVSVPIERIEMLFQDQIGEEGKTTREEFIQAVFQGDARPFEQAVATGGELVIPLHDYVTALAGTPAGKRLLPDVRVGLGQMTMREADKAAKEFEADVTKFRAEVEKASKEDLDPSGQRVLDDIIAQLTAANTNGKFTATEIAEQARIPAAFFVATAKRNDKDAWELYASRKYKIVGPDGAEVLYDAEQARALTQADIEFPRALGVVDGRVVRSSVPNQSSIRASLDKPRILPGIREVPLTVFDAEYLAGVRARPLDERTQKLADEIRASSELNPLIVAMDSKGAYIIEGGHRLDALIHLNATSLPAMIVVDESDPPSALLAQAQPLTQADLDRYGADEAHRLLAEMPDATPQAIAAEMETSVAKVEAWLKEPRPALSVEESRSIALRLAFTGQMLEQAQTLPATLDIDGVQRPTTNSTGAPIALTEQGVRNFWAWFAGSTVVDAEGRPLVVYHSGDFDATVDAVPRVNGEGFHFGTLAAAESRQIGKPVDDFIRGAVFEQDAESGAWYWSSQGVDSFDFDEVGFPTKADAKRDLEANAQDYVGNETEFEEQALTEAYIRVENITRQPDAGSDWTAVVKKAKAKGHDGISYINKFEDKGSTSYVVFTPEQIKSALGNSGAFDPANPSILEQKQGQRPNAFLIPGVSETTIGMMQTANLSSLIHEFSHDYLNILGDLAEASDAPQQTKDDYATVLKYIGAKSRSDIGKKHQEKFARSFERWMATAEAPSRGLLRTFVKFRFWMAEVYETVKSMLVPVSPEIAGVFERMLATDEEIALATRVNGSTPLYSTQAEHGGTDAEWTRYQQAVEHRDAVQSSHLFATMLAEQNKERKEIWKDREAEVRASVEAEVTARPVYRAIAYLKKGTQPDGSEGKAVKLNLALTQAEYGDGIENTLRGLVAKNGVMSADQVALLFDFRDGTDLINALQNAPSRNQEIDRVVNQTMRAEFPDLLGDSVALADEAQKAAHVPDTDTLLIDELQRLGKVLGMQATNVPALNALAREMIGKTVERDLQPSRFLNAEHKAATLSAKALRAGDTVTAEFHKRQQLLNHILYREAVAAQERSEKIVRYAVRMGKEPAQARLGKAGLAYQNAMNALLDSYEFRNVSLVKMHNRETVLAAFVKEAQENAFVGPAIPESVIADSEIVNYRKLTVDQLADVYSTMEQVYRVATNADRMAREQDKRTMEEAEAEIVGEITKYHTLTPRTVDYYPLSLTNAKQKLAAVDAWHLPPEFLFSWLDGDRIGAVHRSFFQPIARAEADEHLRLKASAAEVQRIERMVDLPAWALDTSAEYDGIRSRLNKRAKLALILNWGTESGQEAVLAAGVDEQKQFGSREAILKVFETLTAQELAYVQAKWDYNETFWAEIAELERETTGIIPEKLKATPFTVRSVDGQVVEMKGGYYTLKYDNQLGIGGALREAWDTTIATDTNVVMGGGARLQTLHGWSEERQKANGRPLSLSMSVWNAHIINVIHDLSHRRAVRDVVRLYRRKGIREALVQSAGEQAYKSLQAWLARIANPNQTFDDSPVEKILSQARGGVTAVNMGVKVTTTIVQPLGYLQSTSLIGPRWVTKGILAAYSPDWKSIPGSGIGALVGAGVGGPIGAVVGGVFGGYVGGLSKSAKMVYEMSAAMEMRAKNFSREMHDYIAARGGKWTNRDKFMFALIQMMDMSVAVPTWIGAYRKSMELMDKGNHDAAIQFADSTVRMSQGAGGAKDLSRVQGGPELRRMLTTHYSFLSRQYGLYRRSVTNVTEGRGGVPKLLADMTMLWFASSILSELVAGRGPEDDEDWREWMVVELMRGAVAPLVLVRDVARAVGPGAFAYKLSPVEDAIRASATALNVAYDATAGRLFDDEEFEVSKAELKAIVDAVGYWAKLPSRQSWIVAMALYDWKMGYDVPETPVEATRNLAFPRNR